MPATAARTSRTKAALPASTCAAQGPSLRHGVPSVTTVLQETPAPEENWERDSAGRTPTVPRPGILGSRDKQNSWEILSRARSSSRPFSGRSQGSAGHPEPGLMQVSTQRLGPGRQLRGFAFAGVSRWCRSVGWVG